MSGFQASFIHKNCPGRLLSAYSFFFFLEILNLNLTFAVSRKRDCKSLLVDVTNFTLSQFLKKCFAWFFS